MIVFTLFVLSLFLVLDIDSFNRALDYFVPVYLFLAVVIILMFVRRQRKSADDNEEGFTPFVYKKKPKYDPSNWKARFYGKWDKLTRTGIAEFVVFNGGSSFVASIAKNADFSQEIIDVDGDTKRSQLNAYGIPPQQGSPVGTPDNQESAVPINMKDPNKRNISFKTWWEESQKMLRCQIVYEDNKTVIDQFRTIDENDILHFKTVGTKVDGSTCSFEATLKRSSK